MCSELSQEESKNMWVVKPVWDSLTSLDLKTGISHKQGVFMRVINHSKKIARGCDQFSMSRNFSTRYVLTWYSYPIYLNQRCGVFFHPSHPEGSGLGKCHHGSMGGVRLVLILSTGLGQLVAQFWVQSWVWGRTWSSATACPNGGDSCQGRGCAVGEVWERLHRGRCIGETHSVWVGGKHRRDGSACPLLPTPQATYPLSLLTCLPSALALVSEISSTGGSVQGIRCRWCVGRQAWRGRWQREQTLVGDKCQEGTGDRGARTDMSKSGRGERQQGAGTGMEVNSGGKGWGFGPSPLAASLRGQI